MTTDSTDSTDATDTTGKDAPTHRAGAFDIRNIIAGLIGVYGLVLVAMGLFADPETAKTGGVNANLWAGVVMVVVAAAFGTWARLRPVVVPRGHDREDGSEGGDAHRG